MFCKYCGKETQDGSDICADCKSKETSTVKEPEVINTTNSSNTTTNSEAKSKLAGGLLGIFLGTFGVDNFYLGYTGKAVAQLLITILSCGMLSFASAIWGLIEGILILTGSINTVGEGKPLRD